MKIYDYCYRKIYIIPLRLLTQSIKNTLQEHKSEIEREELAKKGQLNTAPSKDLSLKEGEKIKIIIE
jgi:predicted DNA-binding antitoxin AbrB/MazE fold protein